MSGHRMIGSVAVFDNFLDAPAFVALWERIQQLEFSFSSDIWSKAWSFVDPRPVSSVSNLYSRRPFDNGLDELYDKIAEVVRSNEQFEHLWGDWNDIGFRVYLHGTGSKIRPHTDWLYAGAVVYYAHPVWESVWGGELFLPDVSNISSSIPTSSNGSRPSTWCNFGGGPGSSSGGLCGDV